VENTGIHGEYMMVEEYITIFNISLRFGGEYGIWSLPLSALRFGGEVRFANRGRESRRK